MCSLACCSLVLLMGTLSDEAWKRGKRQSVTRKISISGLPKQMSLFTFCTCWQEVKSNSYWLTFPFILCPCTFCTMYSETLVRGRQENTGKGRNAKIELLSKKDVSIQRDLMWKREKKSLGKYLLLASCERKGIYVHSQLFSYFNVPLIPGKDNKYLGC